MPLSDLKCKSAKATTRTYRLFDGGGLYLEVTPKGQKYWRLKYRHLGKEKRVSFGSYPLTSLQHARDKREEAKRILQKGEDVSFVRKEEKRAAKYNTEQTFETVATEWHNEYSKSWSDSHTKNILYRLKKYIFPHIGSYPISKITAPVLFDCVKITDNRGKHEIAKRTLQNCGQVMRYAVITGRAERDPSHDLKGSLKRANKGHFASIGIKELPELLRKINTNENRLFEQTILAIKMMLLTFVRTSELVQATWDEFDLNKKSWNIPAHRMKMRNSHFVPLSKQVITILARLQELNGNTGYVFPSIAKPGKHMSKGTILMALDRMGYRGRMTGHGFRSLAMSTIKEELGYQHEVVDRQLAHLPVKAIDKAYDRAKFLPKRITMMQDWANYIDKLN